MRDIGKNIRALRIRKKLSQDQLAQILHVTRQTVSNYETGRSRPDVEMLAALAQALDTDVKELLCAPAHREARLRRLHRLTVSAVATALAGALDAVGFLWGRHLMEAFYIGRVYYAAVYLLHPLFTLLLGRTLPWGFWGGRSGGQAGPRKARTRKKAIPRSNPPGNFYVSDWIFFAATASCGADKPA